MGNGGRRKGGCNRRRQNGFMGGKTKAPIRENNPEPRELAGKCMRRFKYVKTPCRTRRPGNQSLLSAEEGGRSGQGTLRAPLGGHSRDASRGASCSREVCGENVSHFWRGRKIRRVKKCGGKLKRWRGLLCRS